MTAVEFEEVYRRASAIAHTGGSELGPDCAPCTHNTLAFTPRSHEDPAHDGAPHLAMVQ